MKRVIVGLPLACDYIPSDPRELSNSPTVRRIKACVDEMRKQKLGSEPSFVVCTAGYTKFSPFTKPENGVPELSLCKQMHQFIQMNYVQCIQVISAVKGWGTESEIREGIALTQDNTEPSYQVTLVVSTNAGHMLRTAIYVWKYLPKGWKVKFVRAHHHFSLKSHTREPLGILHALIGALKFKLLSK